MIDLVTIHPLKSLRLLFDNEEDFLTFLKVKYGEELLVSEDFDLDNVNPELPYGAIEVYKHCEYGRPPKFTGYYDTPDTGEPGWCTITYEVKFDDLIDYIESLGVDKERFFKTCVYTKEEKKEFYDLLKNDTKAFYKKIKKGK